MQTTTAAGGRRTPPPAATVIGLILALGAVLVVLLGLFIVPSLKSGAHGLEIGVVAAEPAEVTQALDHHAPGAYTARPYGSAAALSEAIGHRDVVGGFVVDAGGIEAVVAGAGSTAISGSLSATAAAVAADLGLQVTVTDVVPLPADDPTGVGIGGLAFPLVFGGIVPVAAFGALLGRRPGWRMAGLVAFSAAGGLIVASVLRWWFGSIEQNFWGVAGAMGLGIAGLALPLAGLQRLFGAKGFTIGAASMMFLGNPFAGIATTGSWLPEPIGTIGQLLPPGAAGTLVRSAAYFSGHGGGTAALTLIIWIVIGTVLWGLGAARSRRTEAAQA